MQHTETWEHARRFIEVLIVDIRLGILAEQILTLVILVLAAELQAGGLAPGRVIRLSRNQLCQVVGKRQVFPFQQLESSLRQLAVASFETRQGAKLFRAVLVERWECRRIGTDVEMAIVLSDQVTAMLKQDWHYHETVN